jgi:hypothetical protein
VVKKDGRREPFDRNKVIGGLMRACEKRNVSINTIEDIASKVEQMVQESPDREVPTEKIGEFTFTLATGGEISRDGKYIAVRSLAKTGYLWTRADGESLEAAIAKKPCSIPIPDVGQGEALDFLPDGSGYVTVTEGSSPPIKLTSFKK